MRTVAWVLLLAVGGLLGGACGVPDDNVVDLTPYAGRFSVTETFFQHTGSQCPDPPTEPVYNGVDIDIDKNVFGAEFDFRWGKLVGGEIHEETQFLASRGQLDDRIEFSGDYTDEDNFTAIMKDIRQGCTRIFDLVGVRVAP